MVATAVARVGATQGPVRPLCSTQGLARVSLLTSSPSLQHLSHTTGPHTRYMQQHIFCMLTVVIVTSVRPGGGEVW